MNNDSKIAIGGILTAIVIGIILFISQKDRVDTNITPVEKVDCVISDYWIYNREFDKRDYCSLSGQLEKFLKNCKENIDSSKVYSYIYFMLGYSYERITLDKNYIDCASNSSGAMAVGYYNTYLELNLHREYRSRAFEGIAKILSQKIDVRQLQLALSIVDKGIDEFPDSANLYRLKGNIFISLNFPLDAEKQYTIAIEKNPQNPWNYIGLGSALSLQNKNADALSAYNNALVLDPNNSIALDLIKRMSQ